MKIRKKDRGSISVSGGFTRGPVQFNVFGRVRGVLPGGPGRMALVSLKLRKADVWRLIQALVVRLPTAPTGSVRAPVPKKGGG